MSRRGVRERLRQRASSSASIAQRSGSPDAPVSARRRSITRERALPRPWRERVQGIGKPAPIMAVEFIPNMNASRAERRAAVKRLRDQGVKVTVRGGVDDDV